MTASSVRRQARRVAWTLTCVVGASLLTTPAWAGKKTCLTGTDPEVANDLAQVAATRLAVETNCPCATYTFKYKYLSEHADYVQCASDEVTSAGGRGDLRKQCSSTVKKYYAVSSCGAPRTKPLEPCIKTSGSGKVSCAIKPVGKCSGVACPDFTSCVDAADTNGDGIVGTGDSGACVTDNLLSNPSVEAGELAMPAPWKSGAYLGIADTFAWDNTVAQDGALSLKLASPATPNDAFWTQTVSVQPNTVYRLSGWVKTETVGHTPEIVDAGANLCLFGGFTYGAGLFDTNDWRLLSLTFNSGVADHAVVCARLGFFAGTTTGTAWFDNLRLVALPGGAAPPPPTFTGTPTVTPTRTTPPPPAATFTRTPTITPTPTITLTPTQTPTLPPGAPTYTVTPTATKTPIPTASPSNTPTITPTVTLTRTHTPTATGTNTPIPDPVGCCALPSTGICVDSFGGLGPAYCAANNGTWMPQQHCSCGENCGGSCAPGAPPPTLTPTLSPTPDPRFHDNGDGTISDLQTGLMWEKKDRSGGLHDVDRRDNWAGSCGPDSLCQPNAAAANACNAATGGALGCSQCAFSRNFSTIWDWLVQLNASNFAGHSDWRIPTSSGDRNGELASIQSFPCYSTPCIPTVFKTSCTPGCGVTGCSCTTSADYWSATSYSATSASALYVDFGSSGGGSGSKEYLFLRVRAVR